MELEEAMVILRAHKCSCLGYARDLSFDPTNKQIGTAIATLEEALELVGGEEVLAALLRKKQTSAMTKPLESSMWDSST